ncbi:MAG: hypothetical protein H0U67_10720 [Gemmatimonadetes bacterium]|nr:hypothetical protein [Gemmatimonadota bacterium]
MGIRRWFRNQVLGGDADGNDMPPNASLLHSMLGKEEVRVRSLGEYDADSYPKELTELIRKRAEVSAELLKVDVANPEARVEAIPRLQQLLRKYPHPLVYELLIHAYMDAGRFDEAKGVAFAARERRQECARSPHPEVRAETERLHAWDPAEIDEMRAEYRGPSAR